MGEGCRDAAKPGTIGRSPWEGNAWKVYIGSTDSALAILPYTVQSIFLNESLSVFPGVPFGVKRTFWGREC